MKIHIPTEQYGFVEVDVENAEEAKKISDEIKSEFADKYSDGLSAKEWRNVLDTYLTDYVMHPDEYATMNKFQKDVIQEIKKSFSRIQAKIERDNYEAHRHDN